MTPLDAKPALAMYWPQFCASGAKHGLCPYLLAAICWRETRAGMATQLSKPGPTGTGDGGHGKGLMQVDDRWHAAFVSKVLPDGRMAWQDPASNIDYGAAVLAECVQAFPGEIGLAVAAYNAGATRVKKAASRANTPSARLAAADLYTTNNYASGVLSLWRDFLPIPLL